MDEIHEKPIFQERKQRKIAKERRKKKKKECDLRASLMVDLTQELSVRGITIKNVLDIVDGLIKKGWTKIEFQKRRWS